MTVALVELELRVMYMKDSSSKESSIQLQCMYTLSKLVFATQNSNWPDTMSVFFLFFYANIFHIDVCINSRTPLSHVGDKHKLPHTKMKKKGVTYSREFMLISLFAHQKMTRKRLKSLI